MTLFSRIDEDLKEKPKMFSAPIGSVQNANESIRLASTNNISTSLASRNQKNLQDNELKDKATRNNKLLEQNAPKTTEWIQEDPAKTTVVQAQADHYGFIEQIFDSVKEGYQSGVDSVAMSEIGVRRMRGSATEKDMSTLERYQRGAARSKKQSPLDGYFSTIPKAVAQQIPILTNMFKGGLKGAGAGAVPGAGIGFTTGGPQGAAAGAVIGAKRGFTGGMAVSAALMEAGTNYNEYSQIIDDEGRLVDPDVARGAAIVAGILSAGVETYALGYITRGTGQAIQKQIQSLGARNGGKAAIKKMLKSRSLNDSMIAVFKRIGEGFFVEGATEGIQEMISGAGGEVVKTIANDDDLGWKTVKDTFSKENVAGFFEAAKEGSKVGLAFGGVSGSIQEAGNWKDMKRAQEKAAAHEAIGLVVEDLQLQKENPDQVRKLIEKTTDNSNLYIDANAFNGYWQQQGKDPREVAEAVLGDAQAYDEAIDTGGDIVVPAATYYTSKELGVGEHKEFFAQEVRTDPMDMSAREFDEQIQELDKKIEEDQKVEKEKETLGKKPEKKERIVFDSVKKQLEDDARVDARTATTYASIYEASFKAIGERAGIDPEVLYKAFEPRIRRLGQRESKSFLQKARNTLRQMATGGKQDPTKTKEFKQWFGDSKVVDENGEPLVVYHGTTAKNIEEFDPKKSGSRFGVGTKGFFFTDDKRTADFNSMPENASTEERFSKEKRKEAQDRTIPVYLNIKNPLPIKEIKSHPNYEDKAYFRPTEFYDDNVEIIESLSNKYDGLIYKAPNGETLYVAFDPTQIKSVNNQGTFDPKNPNIYMQASNDPRGAFFRDKDGNFNVSLLENMDRSTFLHESGHFYLEMLRVLDSESKSQDIKDQNKILLDWLGVESFDAITTEHHEKFARGFEAYLMEGKAPSKGLEKAFTRFVVWLKGIYKKIDNLDVELNPEIRGFFDRLLATDAEIAEVQANANLEPLFKDTSILGNKEAKYVAARANYKEYIDEKNSQRVLKEFQKEQKSWYKKELAEEKERARKEVVSNKKYRAFYAIRDSKSPDGTELETPIPKLSKALVEQSVGKETMKGLSNKLFDESGIAPEIAADLFEYDTVQEMIEDLRGIEPINTYVERIARERMRVKYLPENLKSESFKKKVLDDMHSESRAKVLRFELSWLANEAPTVLKDAIRRVSRRMPADKAVKAYAKDKIANKPVSELTPYVFLRAERKAAKEAGEALAKGELDVAFEKKQLELFNHELYKEAVLAKETIDKSLSDFEKLAGKDEKLGKTRDLDYVNAARSLLANFGIGKAEKDPDVYLKNVKEYDPDTYNSIQAIVQESFQNRKPYKQLSYGEFIDFKTTVDALWELSRSSRQIEIDGQKYERKDIAVQLAAQLDSRVKQENRDPKRKTRPSDTWIYTPKAWMTRVESWIDVADNGRIDGDFRKFLFRPLKEATTTYKEKQKEKVEAFLEIVKLVRPSLTQDQIAAPELINALNSDGYVFESKAELLGALLHTGNQSNYRKLLVGNGWGDVNDQGVLNTSRWDAFIARMINEGVITKADYDFAQATWDLLETIKPDAQRAHKKLYGYYFNEITAQEISTPFGTYRGGYVPAKIDSSRSMDQAVKEMKNDLFDAQDIFTFPGTSRGFTKSRIEQFAEPLEFNINFIPAHIDSVLKFTYINPAVKDIGKIVLSKTFRDKLSQVDRSLLQTMFMPWLKRAASQRVDTSTGKYANAVRKARRNVGMNFMFMNFSNAAMQLSGFALSNVKVPMSHLARGAGQYIKHLGSKDKLRDSIAEKSLFMKGRNTTSAIEVQQTINDIVLNPTKFQSTADFFKKHAYFLQTITQGAVDDITWTGAYNYMIEKGETDQKAVDYADFSVRQTQGSFDPEDLSAAETGSVWLRAVLMFYNYFNMKSNLIAGEATKVLEDKGFIAGSPQLTLLFMKTTIVPAAIVATIKMTASGEADKDNDSEFADDIARSLLFTIGEETTGMLPFVGPLVQAGINQFDDKWYNDRFAISPMMSIADTTIDLTKELGGLATGEDVNKRKLAKSTASLLGFTTGIPFHAVGRAAGYQIDVMEGDADPDNSLDYFRGLLTGQRGD